MSAVGDKIRSGVKNARFWAGVFILYVFAREGVGAWQHYDDMHSELRVTVINGETFYVGHAVPIEQQRETHVRLAKEAAISMYGRNPAGLDDIETLKRVFSTPCQTEILNHIKEDAQTYLTSNMSQKFQPDRPIVEVARDDDTCTMLVEGDVVSVRQERGVPIPDSKPMRLIFRLMRNARFGDDGKYPMVVTKFSATYLKDHQAQTPNIAEVK